MLHRVRVVLLPFCYIVSLWLKPYKYTGATAGGWKFSRVWHVSTCQAQTTVNFILFSGPSSPLYSTPSYGDTYISADHFPLYIDWRQLTDVALYLTHHSSSVPTSPIVIHVMLNPALIVSLVALAAAYPTARQSRRVVPPHTKRFINIPTCMLYCFCPLLRLSLIWRFIY